MSALDISPQDVTGSPSSPSMPVSSPTAVDNAPVSNADDGAPGQAETDVVKPFSLTASERRGLLIVLGVALFQEVHSNVFRGVLVGAAAVAAMYGQRSGA
ncbi:hypothetical protein ABB37_05267 [Leptomonas pyrrhocoris]|uniref:Uncharacterized protein n=1 Tax=Leptomonas pyrrhocoris TaxID=157538 RepID=A0A0M9G027_LEPPY|nr:hypothetical protein ABB37_05267 [Leptomonas pyrrhocoris]KPA79427.1 hypothetical protein ABB37_05267 [Leptomonas pyrrhocoris]|eukprot:XP_015657866.1 hypothetical protein ABB37_05267 [Leptomonas pyrrhocoris]